MRPGGKRQGLRVSERSPRFPAATSNPNSFLPMSVFVQGNFYLPGAHVARTRFFQEEVSHGREAFGMTPNHALRGTQTREGDSAQVGRH